MFQSDDYFNDEGGAELTYTVTNGGGIASGPLSTTLDKLNDIYIVDPLTSSCVTGGATNVNGTGLAGGAFCTFNVDMQTAFTTVVGTHAAVPFTVTAGALTTTPENVTGKVAGYLTISSPTSPPAGTTDFGIVAVGSDSAAIAFTLKNNSHHRSTGLFEVSLSDQLDFTITADPVSGINFGGVTTAPAIDVQFNPSTGSAITGTLTVTDSANGDNAVANLQGNP